MDEHVILIRFFTRVTNQAELYATCKKAAVAGVYQKQ